MTEVGGALKNADKLALKRRNKLDAKDKKVIKRIFVLVFDKFIAKYFKIQSLNSDF